MSSDPTNTAQPYVVVADDNDVQRIAMAAMLRRAGFEVDSADSGSAALELIEARRPDALIVDAIMPGLSGFETIERLRQNDDLRTLPAIVVSGLEDVDSRIQALSIGADDFITKPVHAEELAARVRAQLRQAAAWSESTGTTAAERAEAEWLDDVTANRRFDIHFQPVVDMTTSVISAQEALVRFHDGTPPNNVFKAQTPSARQIELELAIAQMVTEQATVFPIDVMVHINVSPATARSSELASIVGSAGRPIVLEITEHELFGPEDAAELRNRMPPSCRLAADDVGAGFAGLTQLVSVRPEIVKIDREIITCIHDDPVRQVVVAGLVRFAAATGARLIAEGVERRGEATMLLELGVQHAQGYYFGRPAPIAEHDAATRLSVVRPRTA